MSGDEVTSTRSPSGPSSPGLVKLPKTFRRVTSALLPVVILAGCSDAVTCFDENFVAGSSLRHTILTFDDGTFKAHVTEGDGSTLSFKPGNAPVLGELELQPRAAANGETIEQVSPLSGTGDVISSFYQPSNTTYIATRSPDFLDKGHDQTSSFGWGMIQRGFWPLSRIISEDTKEDGSRIVRLDLPADDIAAGPDGAMVVVGYSKSNCKVAYVDL